MSPQELANKANETINLWAKSSDKLVVAIDGYTGVGKTTLLNNLANLNPDILAVNRDDFMFSRKIIREKISETKDQSRVWELEACNNKKLEDFVSTFKNINTAHTIDTYNGVSGEINIPKTFDFSKKIMVIEGVFMFHQELLFNKLWDKRIYLKGDIDKITERRIKREKERWGENYFPETHPDSYIKHVVSALERYIKLHQPEKIADLVLKVD